MLLSFCHRCCFCAMLMRGHKHKHMLNIDKSGDHQINMEWILDSSPLYKPSRSSSNGGWYNCFSSNNNSLVFNAAIIEYGIILCLVQRLANSKFTKVRYYISVHHLFVITSYTSLLCYCRYWTSYRTSRDTTFANDWMLLTDWQWMNGLLVL